jgi:hypothetical protein
VSFKLLKIKIKIPYPDSIKLACFENLTQRGDRGVKRGPKDRVKPSVWRVS